MGSFDFAVKLRGGGFDVGVPDALIFYMPMKFSLEFVPVISPHLIDSERETLNDIIYKIDGIGLGMLLIYLKRPNSGGIINRCVLESTDILALFVLKGQEFDIDLYLMARHLLVISFCMDFAHPGSSWQPVELVPAKDAVNSSI